jgi:hypothetical protein
VSAKQTVCLSDCSIFEHTYTLDKNSESSKTFQNVGSSATVTIKVKPLKS